MLSPTAVHSQTEHRLRFHIWFANATNKGKSMLTHSVASIWPDAIANMNANVESGSFHGLNAKANAMEVTRNFAIPSQILRNTTYMES